MRFDKGLASTADQSAGARQAMLIGFVWIPVATQLLAMVLLYGYRLEPRDLMTGSGPGASPGVTAARPPTDGRGEGIPPDRRR